MNEIVRIVRLGRLSKLIKLMKLLRILKFLKKDRAQSFSREFLQLSMAANRMFFFILISVLSIHLVSCMWLFQAQYIKEDDPQAMTWLS